MTIKDHEDMKPYQNKFSSEKELSNHLLLSSTPDIRVISIAQANSLQPLNVTEEIMRKILTYHDVSPDLLLNLFCCGNCTSLSNQLFRSRPRLWTRRHFFGVASQNVQFS